MDCNYYHYLLPWASYASNAEGYFTGSGLPQRFCDESGYIMPIYQALTEWTDEWFADNGYSVNQTVQIIREMFAAAENGYYSAFVNNIHPVRYLGGDITRQWANQVWAYCESNAIPIWTAEKLLDFVHARNTSRFDNISWNGTTFAFDFVAPAPGHNLTLMVPGWIRTNQLVSIQFAGSPIVPSTQTIKGRDYALFTTQAATGQVVAAYVPDVIPPKISNLRTESVTDTSAFIAWSTSERADSRVDCGLSATQLKYHASSTVLVSSHQLQLNALQPNTLYYCRITSVDQAGNSASSEVFTFTTAPPSWILTTTTDFASGFSEGVIISEDGDGELRLPSTLYDSFSSGSLGSQWTSHKRDGGSYTPQISNGIATLANPGGSSGGAYMRSVATFLPGTSLQGRIKFSRGGAGPAPFLYFGLAGTDLLPWALIGTGYTGDEIYTSVYNYRSGDPVSFSLGDIFEQWHDFRIVWESGRIEFWMDGALQRSENVNLPGPLYVFFSAAGETPSSASVSAEWVRVEKYDTSPTLSDTFSVPNGPPANWVSFTNPVPSVGSWSVSSRVLVHGSAGISYHPAVLKDSYPGFRNFNFQVRAESSSILFGLVWGLQDEHRYYMAQFVQGQGMRVYRADDWFYSFAKIGDVPAAPVPAPGQWFTLRLEARNGVFGLYVDGILQTTITDHTYPSGRIGVLGYGGATSRYDDVLVENIEPPSAYPSGVYTSAVFDAGRKFTWRDIIWTGSTPVETGVGFRTRSGNSPVPDALWSEWQPLTSPISSPASRFFQFQAALSTSNSVLLSPIIEQVEITVASTHELPPLGLTSEQGAFVLRWPAWAGGLRLLSTTNLTPPIVWTPLSYEGFITNGYYQYSLAPTNSAEFFRLAPP